MPVLQAVLPTDDGSSRPIGNGSAMAPASSTPSSAASFQRSSQEVVWQGEHGAAGDGVCLRSGSGPSQHPMRERIANLDHDVLRSPSAEGPLRTFADLVLERVSCTRSTDRPVIRSAPLSSAAAIDACVAFGDRRPSVVASAAAEVATSTPALAKFPQSAFAYEDNAALDALQHSWIRQHRSRDESSMEEAHVCQGHGPCVPCILNPPH